MRCVRCVYVCGGVGGGCVGVGGGGRGKVFYVIVNLPLPGGLLEIHETVSVYQSVCLSASLSVYQSPVCL